MTNQANGMDPNLFWPHINQSQHLGSLDPESSCNAPLWKLSKCRPHPGLKNEIITLPYLSAVHLPFFVTMKTTPRTLTERTWIPAQFDLYNALIYAWPFKLQPQYQMLSHTIWTYQISVSRDIGFPREQSDIRFSQSDIWTSSALCLIFIMMGIYIARSVQCEDRSSDSPQTSSRMDIWNLSSTSSQC